MRTEVNRAIAHVRDKQYDEIDLVRMLEILCSEDADAELRAGARMAADAAVAASKRTKDLPVARKVPQQVPGLISRLTAGYIDDDCGPIFH